MDKLLYLYLVSGIFGAGVILVDFFTNAISSFSDGDDSSGSDDDGATGASDHLYDGTNENNKGSYIVDYKKHKSSIVLEFIRTLRTAVYFCVGFGLVGAFAVLTGESAISSLIWSVSVGIISVAIFKVFKRFQQESLDSSFTDKELINHKGQVLISMKGSETGKVKIFFGSITLERYAKLHNHEALVKKGDDIIICDAADNVVYIKPC